MNEKSSRVARAASTMCFVAGLASGAAALARYVFGWGIGFPNPIISLEFVNIPVAVTLALVFFAAGALIGRRTPLIVPDATDRARLAWKAEELPPRHSAHVAEDRVRADRPPEKLRDHVGRGPR